MPAMPYTCPLCLMTSHSPAGEADGYCGNCHARTRDCAAGRTIMSARDGWTAECAELATVHWRIAVNGGEDVHRGLCQAHSDEMAAAAETYAIPDGQLN